MAKDSFEITTTRLKLRPWRESDSDEFARLNANAEVMADLGGPITQELSDQKLDRYVRVFENHGFTRWVVERTAGGFLGYTGITPVTDEHPLGPHHEIGWRLVRDAWGHGYATEAASAALQDGFSRAGLSKVLAYTSADNTRSQAVMQQLGLRRDLRLDFTHEYEDVGPWSALVWATTAADMTR